MGDGAENWRQVSGAGYFNAREELQHDSQFFRALERIDLWARRDKFHKSRRPGGTSIRRCASRVILSATEAFVTIISYY